MIVLDASAAVLALIDDGPARALALVEQLHAPHVVDLEVASSMRRLARAGHLTPGQARGSIEGWQLVEVARHGHLDLLDRIWELRDDVTPYDASYVALAEKLGCPLVTGDGRLSRAPGLRCAVTVLPG